jgi:hypothetical protein
MFNMNIFKSLALSSMLSIGCMASGQNVDSSHSSFMTDETLMNFGHRHTSRDFPDCENSVRPLQLNDFAGNWIFGADSLGGVSGGSTVGTSQTIDGQVFFDRHGNGIVNFVSSALYAGLPGHLIVLSGSDDATITITITDPVHGVGTFFVNIPALPLSLTVNFVVVRSKKTGKAIRIEGHSITALPITTHVDSFTFERQYE